MVVVVVMVIVVTDIYERGEEGDKPHPQTTKTKKQVKA